MAQHAELDLALVFIETRRSMFKTVVLFTTLFILLDAAAIYFKLYDSILSTLPAHIASIGFTGYILYKRIEGDFKRAWILYKGTPVYLGRESDAVANWIRETLPAHVYYFYHLETVAILRDAKMAGIVKLMVREDD